MRPGAQVPLCEHPHELGEMFRSRRAELARSPVLASSAEPISYARTMALRLKKLVVSPASAPDFAEQLGEASALVVAASRGLQTRRWIQRIGVEGVTRAAIREDSFHPAASCA